MAELSEFETASHEEFAATWSPARDAEEMEVSYDPLEGDE